MTLLKKERLRHNHKKCRAKVSHEWSGGRGGQKDSAAMARKPSTPSMLPCTLLAILQCQGSCAERPAELQDDARTLHNFSVASTGIFESEVLGAMYSIGSAVMKHNGVMDDVTWSAIEAAKDSVLKSHTRLEVPKGHPVYGQNGVDLSFSLCFAC